MRILVTGHSGFIGSWLSIYLKSKGHEVFGISDFEKPGFISHQQFINFIDGSYVADVRDIRRLSILFDKISPDVVVHLAAKSLVQESYAKSIEFFETNVVGTCNVFEALRDVSQCRRLVIMTSDKVYRPSFESHDENSQLGGKDPYSASKAAQDILSQAMALKFSSSFTTAIVRAGNVYGPFDPNRDRILPALIDSWLGSKSINVRNPEHTRPWQFVVDCVKSLEKLLQPGSVSEPEIYNVGATLAGSVKVKELIEIVSQVTGCSFIFSDQHASTPKFEEAPAIFLDTSKFEKVFGPTHRTSLVDAVGLTTGLEEQFARSGESAIDLMLKNLHFPSGT